MTWLVLWPIASLVFLLGYFFGVALSHSRPAPFETDADEAALPPLLSTWPRGERLTRGRPVVAIVNRRGS